MRLTDTQKKFRKEMKELQQSPPSPYDRPRQGNPFHQAQSGKIIWFAFITIIVALGVYQLGIKKSAPNLINDSAGLMPSNYIATLDQLQNAIDPITNSYHALAPYHQQFSQINFADYRNVLLQGISACDRGKVLLDGLTPQKDMQALYLAARDYLANSELALKNYLEFTYSRKQSTLAIANNYNEMAQQSSQQYQIALIDFLSKNNCQYEILEDGSIRYWYKKLSFKY